MAANDDDLLGMLGAPNFSDDVGGIDGAVGGAILDIDLQAGSLAAVEVAFERS